MGDSVREGTQSAEALPIFHRFVYLIYGLAEHPRQWAYIGSMRLVAAAVVCALSMRAQPRSSVADLIDVVRAAIAAKRPDDQAARSLRKLRLVEKLDDRSVEELESEG